MPPAETASKDITPSAPKPPRRVVIIAGEVSADLHGAHLVTAMRRLDPDITFCGIGGEKMAEAGVRLLLNASEMAVVGLTEVFGKLRTILNASRKIKSLIREDRPDLLVLIDYPDFNLHIAKTAKKFQTPVLYYISPQVWAWRGGRVKKIAKRVDRMAVILPFEKAFYEHTPLQVDYVGHPLLDEWNPEMGRQAIVLGREYKDPHPVVGLLPGSRTEEIRNLLPVMVDAAEILAQAKTDAQFVLPLAPGIEEAFVRQFTDRAKVEIQLIRRNTYEILNRCDVAMVTSGTATLETAVMGVPMVIVYRLSPVTFWIAKRVVKVPYIGLVNLVAGDEVAPELIQGELTPDRLAREALVLLENTQLRADVIRKLKGIREKLGQGGASDKTAGIALEMMKPISPAAILRAPAPPRHPPQSEFRL
jgi:lipid-A-disaccharide synthase